MKIQFNIKIDEANDDTVYEILINGLLFAILTFSDIHFYNADQFNINMSEQMRILDLCWKEFERRDAWSDFEFETEL